MSDQQVLDDIEQFGWHVIKVFAEGELPAFAYSIGLFKTFKQPEIVIIGLDLDEMHAIINDIGEEMRKGRRFESKREYSDLLANDVKLRMCAVQEKHYREYFGYGIWYYKDCNFPILQAVWPAKDGHFPDDPEFPDRLRLRQPLLCD